MTTSLERDVRLAPEFEERVRAYSPVLAVTAVLTAAALTGCDRPDDRICNTPLPLEAALKLDEKAKSDACVHRWAYRLARSSDTPDRIADAVMGGCQDTLFPLAYARYQRAKSNAVDVDAEVALHFRTGKEEPIGAVVYDEQRAKALFHIAQARAGHCSAP